MKCLHWKWKFETWIEKLLKGRPLLRLFEKYAADNYVILQRVCTVFIQS